MNNGYVKTFEDYAKELNNQIPKEGEVKSKKNRKVFLGPDTQNPTSNAQTAVEVGAKYPHGGL